MRDLSRLELVGKTLLHALNSLAVVNPEWLKASVPVAWVERYNTRWEDYRLPKTEDARHFCRYEVVRSGDRPQQISGYPQI